MIASVRNCLNCVQNCDDHGLLDLFLLLLLFFNFFCFLVGSGFCQKAQSIFEEMNVRISTNPSWFLFLVKVVVTKHLTVHALWGQFLMCLILLFNGRCILVIKISEKRNPRKVQTELKIARSKDILSSNAAVRPNLFFFEEMSFDFLK